MLYNPAKQVWLNPNIEYLFNDEIIEYDMKDAGFSLIKEYKLLPENVIRELTELGKGQERHVAIGKLQGKDREFSKALASKFADMRTIFIASNNLGDDNIISVKKDAIFTVGSCSKTKFGSIQFASKNTYSSYIRFPQINNLEIYYNDEQLDIKGMGEHVINRHRLYLLDFIKTTIGMIEAKDISVRRYVNKFIMDYKSHNLDDEYYIEFNSISKDYNALFNFQNVIIPFVHIIVKEIE